jgi:hypothetical protein
MKKISILLLAAFAVLASCQTAENIDKPSAKEGTKTLTVTLTASMPESKTYIEKDGTVYHPHWTVGDQISVFTYNGTTAVDNDIPFSVTSVDASTGAATFTGTIPAPTSDVTYKFYAIYPYCAGITDATAFKFPIAQKQTSTATSFDPSCDVLVATPVDVPITSGTATTTANFSFTRLTSVVRFNISYTDLNSIASTDEIESVYLTSTGNTIGGSCSIDLTAATPTITPGAVNTVHAIAPASTTCNNSSLYLSVVPTSMSNGFRVGVKFKNGMHVYKDYAGTDKALAQSTVQPININLANAGSWTYMPLTIAAWKDWYNTKENADCANWTDPTNTNGIGTNDRYVSATTGTGKMEYYNNVAKTTIVRCGPSGKYIPYVQYSTPGDYFIFSATAASVIPAGRTIQFTSDFYVSNAVVLGYWRFEYWDSAEAAWKVMPNDLTKTIQGTEVNYHVKFTGKAWNNDVKVSYTLPTSTADIKFRMISASSFNCSDNTWSSNSSNIQINNMSISRLF